MYFTYSNIFKRCGLNFRVVSADSGSIGGNASQEFMIVADTGEDAILYCNNCTNAANIEKASTIVINSAESNIQEQKVHTPSLKTIEEVASFLNIPIEKTIKAIVFKFVKSSSLNFVIVFIRGDYQANDAKLQSMLTPDNELDMATEDEVRLIWGEPGFIGPSHPIVTTAPFPVSVIFDDSLDGLSNAVCGANEKDYHLKNINIFNDSQFKITYCDVKTARPNDTCNECKNGHYISERGIEVGHIFKLGTKYSQAMAANYLDQDGKQQPFIMGCYGIGIGRTAMAAIEQHHDEKGPLWPVSIAPFEIIIIPANIDIPEQSLFAENLYSDLISKNIDVLLDDRSERIGVKFNDADLIGSPIRIVVGKRLVDGFVEINWLNGKKEEWPIDKVSANLVSEIQKLKI